jgi:lipopolysaccharide export LptBFGC system permease protein LptF
MTDSRIERKVTVATVAAAVVGTVVQVLTESGAALGVPEGWRVLLIVVLPALAAAIGGWTTPSNRVPSS